jgi:type VI secretion system secreted protein VgrG
MTHAGDAVASQAQTDATTAYDSLSTRACTADLSGRDLGGLTLTAGVYCFASSAQLTGALVLDAAGRSDAVFIFKIGSTLTTASAASVRVINGGTGCDVFWRVGSSATLGTGTTFSGSIFALASVTLNTNAKVDGRTVARTGAVTMDTNAVSLPICRSAPDAGAADARQPDGQVPPADAATTPDASPTDAATTPDSSVIDAGTPPADAATTPDASPTEDAATPPDAGEVDSST